MTSRQSGLLLASLGVAIVLLILAALSLHVPGSIWAGTLARKDGVIALLVLCAVLYAAAIALVLRGPLPGWALWVVIGVAVAMRGALVPAPPFMSSDVYRYVWDGRVQAAGINPYRYVPADAALAGLRDAEIYPRINRAGYARTIYPPAAQAIFALAGQISQTVLATKLAMVLIEAAGIWAMARLLIIAGLPAARVLIYAWNPLAAWAVAGDGHIDGVAIGFLGLAMLASSRRRDSLAGGLLAGAILVKFLPLAVAPALWRGPRSARPWWVLPLSCLAVMTVLYACYAGVGWQVLGFLPTYATEEGLSQGSGFWLLGLAGRVTALPRAANALYLAVCMGLLAWLALRIAFFQAASPDPGREALRVGGNVGLLAGCTIAAMSPHYPWYYSWLALPACLRPWPSLIYLSVAPLILYCDPWHDEIVFPTLVFVPALGLLLHDMRRRAPHTLSEARPA